MRWSSFLAGVALLAFVPSLPTHAQPSRAEPQARWLPEACRPLLELPAALHETGTAESSDARWNRHYRSAWKDFDEDDLQAAELRLCHALAAARDFDRGDLRFAETLDELGLVGWRRGDAEYAEAMQGAAVAEILLALGPPASDLSPEERDHYRSSLSTYLTRLGWIFEQQGRAEELEILQREPYRILGRGYVPADALAPRLDWLISRYLLMEDIAAADWLTALRRELRQATP